jgi:hypothetical protein
MVSNGPALDKTPTPEELATALDSSTALCRELHDKTVSLGRVVADLQSTVAALTTERDGAKTEAAHATGELSRLKASLPSMASAKAMEILASFGVSAPAPSGKTSTGQPASAGAGSIRERFAALRPGSPEAGAFFAQHRKELLG